MAEWICRNIYQISQKVSAIYIEISFFIASDFSNRASTQYYLQQNLKQFKEHDILFQEANIIDDEITPAESVQLITEADVILLAGGPNAQTDFIHSQIWPCSGFTKKGRDYNWYQCWCHKYGQASCIGKRYF